MDSYLLASLLVPLLFTAQSVAAPVPQTNTEPDNAAGASGSDSGAYNLSTGGLVAIIIVVVAVLIVGSGTLALFIIAKRRSWTMRETLKRASRRLTGRGTTAASGDRRQRQARQGAVRMESPPRKANGTEKKTRPGTLLGADQLAKFKSAPKKEPEIETKEFQQPKIKAILPPSKK